MTKILWFTGLSGAGKTTLAKTLDNILKKKYKTILIDGDKFRKKTKTINKFTSTNIIKNNLSIIKYIETIKNNYDYVLVAVIAPLIKTRSYAKKTFGKTYYEIHTFCRLETLIKRDTKNLYKKAENKILNDLIGFNSTIKYQKSRYKTVKVDTDKYNLKQSIKIIKDQLKL
jgi:adenylylsulfate kinase-like enzyme